VFIKHLHYLVYIKPTTPKTSPATFSLVFNTPPYLVSLHPFPCYVPNFFPLHYYAAYRSIVFQDPVFIRYFQAATPESELANLNIGSRPSRRKAGADVTTLRAIPWIFAWTQNRMVLPAWLGVADAIQAAVADGKADVLRDMYEHWPFFTSVVDLIEMVLTKADMAIAALYDAHLVAGAEERAMGEGLRRRFYDTGAAVMGISGHVHLGDGNTTLKHLVRMRNPFSKFMLSF
jgi:phosphoenolpyruvate carboxylase